jgi:hypothetical protein
MLRQQPISVGAPLAQVGLRQQRRVPNLKCCWRNARQYTPLCWRTVGAPRQRGAALSLRLLAVRPTQIREEQR